MTDEQIYGMMATDPDTEISAESGRPLTEVRAMRRTWQAEVAKQMLVGGYRVDEIRAQTGATPKMITKAAKEIAGSRTLDRDTFVAMVMDLFREVKGEHPHLAIKCLSLIKETEGYHDVRKPSRKKPDLESRSGITAYLAQIHEDLYSSQITPAAARALQPVAKIAASLIDTKPPPQPPKDPLELASMSAEEATARVMGGISEGKRVIH